ncbi:MAG: Riboflavin synthase [Lentisphaerae bacterium ADurb.BinA184]|nr:MAG: Riboflavin synthase [Lentisphaerae bacterium ADurb.BinA184]
MFTGLIEDVGVLAGRRSLGQAGKLEVRTGLPLNEVRVGDSLAVNGACLTVESVQAAGGTLTFHTLAETLRRTNLGSLPLGARVNLERAMRLGDRLGGHLVAGHIDTTAEICGVRKEDDDWVVTVALPAAIAHLVIVKGSIAVDGISLTVAELAADRFAVHVIPHTWAHTNLAEARAGAAVNLEADLVGKYILRQREVAGGAGGLAMRSLEAAGFGG